MNFTLSFSELRFPLYLVCCLIGILIAFLSAYILGRTIPVPQLDGTYLIGIFFRVVIGAAGIGFFIYLCVELPNMRDVQGIYLGTSERGGIYLCNSTNTETTLEVVKGVQANRTFAPVGKVRTFMRRISDGADIVGKPFQYPWRVTLMTYLFLSAFTYFGYLFLILGSKADKSGPFASFGELIEFSKSISVLNRPALILGVIMFGAMLISTSIRAYRSQGIDQNLGTMVSDWGQYHAGETVQGKVIALRSFPQNKPYNATFYYSSTASVDYLGDPTGDFSGDDMRNRVLTIVNYWVIEIPPRGLLRYPTYINMPFPPDLKPEAIKNLQAVADKGEVRDFKIESDLSLKEM